MPLPTATRSTPSGAHRWRTFSPRLSVASPCAETSARPTRARRIVADRVSSSRRRPLGRRGGLLRAEAERDDARRPYLARAAKDYLKASDVDAAEAMLLSALVQMPGQGDLYRALAVDVYTARGDRVRRERPRGRRAQRRRHAADVRRRDRGPRSARGAARAAHGGATAAGAGTRGRAVSASNAAFCLSDETALRWYAVWTRNQCEVKVEDGLCQKRLDVFLPLLRVPSRRRDRRVILAQPLFPGYLFVRFAPSRERYVTSPAPTASCACWASAGTRCTRLTTRRWRPCAASSPRAEGARSVPWIHIGDRVASPGRSPAPRSRARPPSRTCHVRGERRSAPAQRGRRGRRGAPRALLTPLAYPPPLRRGRR